MYGNLQASLKQIHSEGCRVAILLTVKNDHVIPSSWTSGWFPKRGPQIPSDPRTVPTESMATLTFIYLLNQRSNVVLKSGLWSRSRKAF
jgi:hypothetical protein